MPAPAALLLALLRSVVGPRGPRDPLRGARPAPAAVPLAACLVGMTAGSYYGGLEGKPMMNDALLARPIQGVHQRRGEGGRPMANGEPGAHTQ